MATTLPAATDFTGVAVTEGGQKTFMTSVRAFIADLFGTDSTMLTAHTAFKNYDGATFHNGSLTASVGSSNLTIALKTAAGNDPSATDPVLVVFRNATIGTGTVTLLAVTSALSIVVPSGGTMGQTNAVAARLWVALINNAGTVELAVVNTQTTTGIFPVREGSLISTVALGTGSDSAGVWYSTTLRSNVAMRVAGYIESTQATAGTWATTPSVVQTMGPGVRLPGDVVQTVSVYQAAQQNRTGSTAVTDVPGATASITPTSVINKVRIYAAWVQGNGGLAANNVVAYAQFLRGATNLSGADAFVASASVSAGGIGMFCGQAFGYIDSPASVSAQTYKLQYRISDGSATAYVQTYSCILDEVMV